MEPRTLKSVGVGCGCSATSGCGCFVAGTILTILCLSALWEFADIREWWTHEENYWPVGLTGGVLIGILSAIVAFFLGAWLAGKYIFKQ